MAFHAVILLSWLAAAALLSNEMHQSEAQHLVEIVDDDGVRSGEEGTAGKGEEPAWLGIGALSDMQSFFENLKNNLDYLETLPQEERDVLLGKAPVVPDEHERGRGRGRDRITRPGSQESGLSGSAAYLHALRSQRPSYKIRNFVDSSEPRGSHRYDPSLLWTGLGKRR